MRALSDKLTRIYTRVGGGRFKAILTTTPSPNQNGQDKAPLRVLTIKHPHSLVIGDVVRSPGGTMELLMDHPDSFDWANSFVAAYVSQSLPWQRMTKVVDPVSKALKDDGLEDLGVVYCHIDSGHEEDFEKMGMYRYRFLTGQDVQEGDLVGPYKVKSVILSRGVRLVQCV